MDLHRFESVISSAQYSELLALIQRAAGRLRGRVIWNVNSTAKGGGVVELLRPLLGYSRGGGVDARWVVISGDSDFFVITKRLHNHLHGIDGDGGPLSADEHASYERTLAANAVELARLVRPSDVVILHDPQTAGLVGAVHATGATVIWRCHVGLDHDNVRAHEAWDFLAPYLRTVDACVFSRSAYMWEGLSPEKVQYAEADTACPEHRVGLLEAADQLELVLELGQSGALLRAAGAAAADRARRGGRRHPRT
jgi:trehalose synthase